jgi:hypothetical protein
MKNKKLVTCPACGYQARKLWQIGSVRVCKKCSRRAVAKLGVQPRRAR